MDKRTIIGIIACVLFYLGYTKYLQYKYPEYGKPTPAGEQLATQDQTKSGTDAGPAPVPTALKPEAATAEDEPAFALLSQAELRLENPDVVYQFVQKQSALSSIKLKSYQSDDLKKKAGVELITGGPLAIQATAEPSNPRPQSHWQAERVGNTLIFSRPSAEWLLTQKFIPADKGFGATVETSFKNLTDKARSLDAGLLLQEDLVLPKKSSSLLPDATQRTQAFIAGVDGSRSDMPMRDYCDEGKDGDQLKGDDVNIDFVGADEHYFVKVIRPLSKKASFQVSAANTDGEKPLCSVAVIAHQNQGQVGPGETATLKYSAYFGPKELEDLTAADPLFKEIVYMGWFTVIARPLLIAVKSIYNWTGNYGLAIILLTLIIKILFYPLTRAAAVSMKNMQKYQPQINKIKEKYKDDRQTQQKEIMQFMSQHKINPAKGCLPILPQIPVFVAFYNVLSNSIELRQAPFYGWIHDLAAPDPFYVTPLLLGAGMLLQQRLTPTANMDKTQERIMMFMPIVFTLMFFSMPAGMVLYMITNTIVSIAQQQWLNKKLDMKPAELKAAAVTERT